MTNNTNGRRPNPAPKRRRVRHQRPAAVMEQSLKARADAKRDLAAQLADQMTAASGSMLFLVANVVLFVVWIAFNIGIFPGLPKFDPFPFSLLTMIVSLEAIILAIVVLISQNRAARTADLREEVALQVEKISEQEITKILELVVKLLNNEGIDVSRDEELKVMLRATDTDKLTEALEREV